MDGLKIGVLTFHRCINYGSYWQTRCLVEGLQKRGHDAVVLDHQSPRINFAEWRCALQPVLPEVVPGSDRPLYRMKIEKFLRAFEALPLSRPFKLERPDEMDDFDAVIVGSDEVWNLFHPWYGGCPLFFGEGVRGPRLVSYAASFGNYDSSWGLEQFWTDKLRDFESISVRDENSRLIINNALGFDPVMVLDPCLQFPISAGENRDPDEQGYVAVYGHNFSEFFVREIRRWADHHRLALISIGYRNDWADKQWITADPADFAGFIAHSAAVATNFFHGCVFALLNSKPFVCESSPYRGHKIRGLMKKIGAEKHLAMENTPAAVYDQHLDKPVEDEILKNIDKLRDISDSFLDIALEPKQIKYA